MYFAWLSIKAAADAGSCVFAPVIEASINNK
jgi:hypothetical protein